MQTRQIIVRVSIGIALAAGPALAQTGVRMHHRGGVRIGSPSAGATSRGFQRVPVSAVVGGNSFFHHGHGGHQGRIPRTLHHGDSIRFDGRLLNDDVSVHFGDHSGFNAKGRLDDGDFSLRFHLGSGQLHDPHHVPIHHSRVHRVFHPHFGLPYYRNYGYYDNYRYYDPVYAIGPAYVSQPAPPPPPAVVTEPQTPYEEGLGHLWTGEIDDAVRVLHSVVVAADAAAEAQRMLALALIAKGRLADGVAMMRSAYDNDPALAREPIERGVLGPQAREALAQLVRKTSIHANQVESASAWLTLGALMQAQGRPERAGMMLGRAVDAGLDRNLAEAFGLTIPPPN